MFQKKIRVNLSYRIIIANIILLFPNHFFAHPNPERFLSDFNGWNKQKFETFLKQTVPRELETFEIDEILEEWCDDISFGYKNTTIDI